MNGSGEGAYYYQWMEKKFGLLVIDELMREGRNPVKWTQERLQFIMDKIKELEAKLERGEPVIYWDLTVEKYRNL